VIRYTHRNPLDSAIVNNVDKYPWSSHQGYLSDAKKWDWLFKGLVLSMFSDDTRLSRTRYREFGVATYSSVSSVIERIKAVIAKDRKLRHRVEELKKEITMGAR
jgi:hypothetical protein